MVAVQGSVEAPTGSRHPWSTPSGTPSSTGSSRSGRRRAEANLPERFGGSRGSVRIALLELSAEGLVGRVPNRGPGCGPSRSPSPSRSPTLGGQSTAQAIPKHQIVVCAGDDAAAEVPSGGTSAACSTPPRKSAGRPDSAPMHGDGRPTAAGHLSSEHQETLMIDQLPSPSPLPLEVRA